MKELRKEVVAIAMDAVRAASTENTAPEAGVVLSWLRTWEAVFPRAEEALTAVPVKLYVFDRDGAHSWAVFGTESAEKYAALREWAAAPCALSAYVFMDADRVTVNAHWRAGAK